MTQKPSDAAPAVLLHSGAPQELAAKNVVTINFSIKDGPSGVLVPLFVGAEAADRFRLSLGGQGKGATIFPLPDFDALEVLLVDLKKIGTTHVNFNAERDRPNPIPIDEVIDSLRGRFGA